MNLWLADGGLAQLDWGWDIQEWRLALMNPYLCGRQGDTDPCSFGLRGCRRCCPCGNNNKNQNTGLR